MQTYDTQRLNDAARAIYALVQPEGGLDWHALTVAQQAGYIERARIAARGTSLLAQRAAIECAAVELAARTFPGRRYDEFIPVQRAHMRHWASDIVSAYRRALREGHDALDAIIAGRRDRDVREMQAVSRDRAHALALELGDDQTEPAMAQARRDIAAFGGAA